VSWTIKYDEIEIQSELGRGGYGVVFQGIWRKQQVAVKQLLNANLLSEEDFNNFFAEARIMAELRPHTNVQQLFGVCNDPVALVTKFYENGSLTDYMKHNQLSIQIQFKIIKGMTAGMLHLENERLVHRDLAARNILLNSQFEAIVADFGYARVLESNYPATTNSDIGPIRWMAPESIIKRTYSSKSDVWAWGTTVWEIQTGGQHPFSDITDGDVIIQVNSGKTSNYLKFPSNTPKKLINLVKQCWNLEPSSRPSFQTLFEQVEIIEGMIK